MKGREVVVAFFPITKEKPFGSWEGIFKQCILDSGVENGAVVYLPSAYIGEASAKATIDGVRTIMGDKIGHEFGYNFLPNCKTMKKMQESKLAGLESTAGSFDTVVGFRSAIASVFYSRLVDLHEVYLNNQPDPFKGLEKEEAQAKFAEMFQIDIGHVFKRLQPPSRPGKPEKVDEFADFADPALRPLAAAQQPAPEPTQMDDGEQAAASEKAVIDEELIKVMKESSSSMASSAQILQATASFIHQHGGSSVTNIGSVTNIDKHIEKLAQTHNQHMTINSPPGQLPNQNMPGPSTLEGVGGRLTSAEQALALTKGRMTRSGSNQQFPGH